MLPFFPTLGELSLKVNQDIEHILSQNPKPSFNPPASTAAKLEIPEGTFVLTYDKLDSEAIIQSVRDDRVGAIAVFIGATPKFSQGALNRSAFFPMHSRRLLVLGLRSSYNAFRMPSAQHNGRENNGRCIFICSHERSSVRARCII